MAVIFFGLARSLPVTIESIRRNIYACNSDTRLSFYTIASLNAPETINSPRAGEVDVTPNPSEIFLLNADFYAIARQDDTDIDVPLAAARKYRDVFDNNWASIRNLLHQLASLQRAWSICTSVLDQSFDCFVFLRPDLIYLDALNLADLVAGFRGEGNIALPAWHSYGGYNDRFAVADAAGARHYAGRLGLVGEYCRNGALHPESLLSYALRQAGCKVWRLPMRARRARANGTVIFEPFDQSVIDLPELQVPRTHDIDGAIVAPATKEDNEMIQTADATAPIAHERPIFNPGQASVVLRQGNVDGYARVSPLRGMPYIEFLRALHRSRQVANYLEIGTQEGKSLDCATGRAIAIDPEFRLDKSAWALKPGIHLFEMTSDDFFSTNNPERIFDGKIDLAFIDGMHLSDFVLRDFANVERYCSPDSIIVLHDAVPINFEMAERERRPWLRHDTALAAHWTGDVWRVLPLLRRERPDLRIDVLDCPPTGLVLISNLNPEDKILPVRLEELIRSLKEFEPDEHEFWSFIASLAVLDSTQSLAVHQK